MKKYAIALFMLSLATFGFAGSGARSYQCPLASGRQCPGEIMAAPDKGIPDEVLNGAKCIAVVPNMAKGGIHRWRRTWTGRGHLPDGPWLECASIHFDRWRQLRLPGGCPVSRSRHVVHE